MVVIEIVSQRAKVFECIYIATDMVRAIAYGTRFADNVVRKIPISPEQYYIFSNGLHINSSNTCLYNIYRF
jgi:hypothetical protein